MEPFGNNDAPTLAAANTAGVAIAATDFIRVDSDIAKVTEMLDISKQTLTVAKQNLVWAFA